MDILDDKYWLSYAKNNVIGSIEKINEASQKLATLTLWFWGVYSTVFAIGTSFNFFNTNILVLVLFALPTVLLLITYWFCHLAQMPIPSGHHPRIIEEIKDSYNEAITIKQKRYRIAIILTFISVLSVGAAGVSKSILKENKAFEILTIYDKDQAQIFVSAMIPSGTNITVNVDTLSINNSSGILYNSSMTVLSSGQLHIPIPFKSQTVDNAIVLITYMKGSEKIGFYKEVKIK